MLHPGISQDHGVGELVDHITKDPLLVPINIHIRVGDEADFSFLLVLFSELEGTFFDWDARELRPANQGAVKGSVAQTSTVDKSLNKMT